MDEQSLAPALVAAAGGFAAFAAGFAGFFGVPLLTPAAFVRGLAAFGGKASLLSGAHRGKAPVVAAALLRLNRAG